MWISIVIAYCIAFEFLAAMIYMHLISTIPSCEIKSLMPLINRLQALYPSRLSSDFFPESPSLEYLLRTLGTSFYGLQVCTQPLRRQLPAGLQYYRPIYFCGKPTISSFRAQSLPWTSEKLLYGSSSINLRRLPVSFRWIKVFIWN